MIAIRPSGTEPKIKFYFSVNIPLIKQSEFENLSSSLTSKIDQMCEDIGLLT